MFVHLVIHHPKPQYVDDVLQSMRRVDQAAAGAAGLIQIGPWRSDSDDRLLGLAMWESEEVFIAARDAIFAITAGDDFDTWLARPTEVFRVTV